jgi:hypothetical protein
MKEFLKANIDERPLMIFVGVWAMYLLIEFFAVYLLLLHRINIRVFSIFSTIFMLIYIPRFNILHKIRRKDKIRLSEESLIVNGKEILFSDIKAFRVKKEKPKVVFSLNNKMIVFNQAKFVLKLSQEVFEFNAIGSEKIELLTEFLELTCSDKKDFS